ncbi:aminodeoxychorismate synthase, component I, partial [Methylobacterium sp. WL122]
MALEPDVTAQDMAAQQIWTREIPFVDPVAAAMRLRRWPGLAFLDSAMRH